MSIYLSTRHIVPTKGKSAEWSSTATIHRPSCVEQPFMLGRFSSPSKNLNKNAGCKKRREENTQQKECKQSTFRLVILNSSVDEASSAWPSFKQVFQVNFVHCLKTSRSVGRRVCRSRRLVSIHHFKSFQYLVGGYVRRTTKFEKLTRRRVSLSSNFTRLNTLTVRSSHTKRSP